MTENAEASIPDNGAAVAASSIPPSADGWSCAYDHNSQAWYYYNAFTGQRQWDPPPSWVPNDAAPTAEPESTAATPSTSAGGAGYYYTDANGVEQGPFTIEQLRTWRGNLPMDLPVWYQKESSSDEGIEEEKRKEKAEEDEKKDGKDTDEQVLKEDEVQREKKELEEVVKRETAAAEKCEVIDLARVLGDEKLLEKWRSEHPENKLASCAAPNAIDFEQEQNKDTYTSLAEAVVAGLPANDEAVQLAWAAKSAGQSLEEVVAWSREQGNVDYTATALHAAGRGRIQSADGPRESIYAEYSKWIDPRKMEEQMEKVKSREKRKLTAEELRALKTRKQEKKEKKIRAWLLD